ncbi:ATP phosphoribosyltransferase regulatory subunit [Rhodosalinus sp.]|uniref:ATP phosphoribosyltransferase regulatory subunit n=1 Tax=Rhodosalinus sp. TaxID=2047741 RepID=UPI00356734F9
MTPASADTRAATRAEAARLVARFEAAGARAVDCAILQPADTLLDLYGEDIRARAYTTHDPLRGERMLRPDFTVPVVEMHMAEGAEPARYTYAGEVFRRQEDDPDRASEYIQAGYEVFDGADPTAAEAEVFALFAEALAPLGLRAATGDIGLLTAAVQGLRTTDRRKAALLRHIWRPRRFRDLLDRFAGRRPVPTARVALLNDPEPMAHAGPLLGLRSEAEIMARVAALREDAAAPPVAPEEVAGLDALLDVRDAAPRALDRLRGIAQEMPAILPAVDRLAARLAALAGHGIDVDRLDFEASYGRTSMEYYDGFVFGFYAEGRDLPPVASGGRYDALTRQLGRGAAIPAVGGVIRPGLTLALGGAA